MTNVLKLVIILQSYQVECLNWSSAPFAPAANPNVSISLPSRRIANCYRDQIGDENRYNGPE